MANELKLNVAFNYAKGSLAAKLTPSQISVTVTGDKFVSRRLTCALTPGTPLDFGGITSPGWVVGLNKDAANFVTIAPNNVDAAMVQVEAGEPFLFRIEPSATPQVVADTAPVEIEYILLED